MFFSEGSFNNSRTTIFMNFTPDGTATGSVSRLNSSVWNVTGLPDTRLTGMRLMFVHQNTAQESFLGALSFMI